MDHDVQARGADAVKRGCSGGRGKRTSNNDIT
jgi:hypothetical protein